MAPGGAGAPAGDKIATILTAPGIAAAEPMQHRFAYVGNDLQDLYGIDPQRIGRTTNIANSYFANGDARATLASLSRTPDGVLVSQETVNDFQLAMGDIINLRLQSVVDHQYHVVPVVKEFPTASRDSFFAANSKYVTEQPGSAAAEIVLTRAAGDPAAVAAAIMVTLGAESPLKTTDIGHAARLIGSSLTAIDLRALTSIELSFAVLLATAATGLILVLGFGERSRTMAILSALGARWKSDRFFGARRFSCFLVAFSSDLPRAWPSQKCWLRCWWAFSTPLRTRSQFHGGTLGS
jgi:putative ABC transport system permease protein